MCLWHTHRDESPLLRFIDSKQVTRDFRRSVTAILQQLQAREPLNPRKTGDFCPYFHSSNR